MIAVDTNVLVYYLDQNEAVKQAKAIALLNRLITGPPQTILLGQVLAEVVRQLRTWQDKGRLTRQAVLVYVAHFRGLFPFVMPTPRKVVRLFGFRKSEGIWQLTARMVRRAAATLGSPVSRNALWRQLCYTGLHLALKLSGKCRGSGAESNQDCDEYFRPFTLEQGAHEL